MFGIGIQEAVVILAVALLVLGPTKLPGVARTLGKGLRELRKASDDLRSALMFDDEDEPRPKRRPPIPAPPVADAPIAGTETAATAVPAAGIHGSLVAGAAVATASQGTEAGAPKAAENAEGVEGASAASSDDEPVAVPVDADTIVSRGQSGADPHKRALDPEPRWSDDEPPRHEPFAVPDDPDATRLLDEGRRARVDGGQTKSPTDKDVTT